MITTTRRTVEPAPRGVFVAQAWREDDGFRARIRYSAGATADSPAETEVYVADPDDVRRHLDAWVLAILTQA